MIYIEFRRIQCKIRTIWQRIQKLWTSNSYQFNFKYLRLPTSFSLSPFLFLFHSISVDATLSFESITYYFYYCVNVIIAVSNTIHEAMNDWFWVTKLACVARCVVCTQALTRVPVAAAKQKACPCSTENFISIARCTMYMVYGILNAYVQQTKTSTVTGHVHCTLYTVVLGAQYHFQFSVIARAWDGFHLM